MRRLKKRLIYVGVVLFTFFEAMVFEPATPAVLLAVELMLVPILWGMAWVQARMLCLTADCDEAELVAGSDNVIALRVNNRAFWPLIGAEVWVDVAYGSEKAVREKERVSLAARREDVVFLPLDLPYCGEARLRVSRCEVWDCLGIFSSRKRISWERTVRVQAAPVFVNLEELRTNVVIGEDGSLYHTNQGGYDPSEVYQVREYQEGDRLSTVQWKLSAKTGDLLVKEFSLPRKSSYLLMLDGRCRDQRTFHRRVTTLLSLSKSMTAQGVVHTIAWLDEAAGWPEMRVVQDEETYRMAAELLIGIAWEGASAFPLEALARFYPQVQYVKLFLVTGGFCEAEADLLQEYRGAAKKALFLMEEPGKREWKDLEVRCLAGNGLLETLTQLPIWLSM